MREAVIVSTARTPIGRAFRGAYNDTKSPTLLAHAVRHAVERSGLEGEVFEDAVIGTVLAGGTAGGNLARNAVFAAGLPVSVSAQTMDRQCSSGLMAIATAAKQVTFDGMDAVIAGGQENISAVQNDYFGWVAKEADPNVVAMVKTAYMPMLHTAEFVSKKYGISREVQDRYSLESQIRTARAQELGLFDKEIVPLQARMKMQNKGISGGRTLRKAKIQAYCVHSRPKSPVRRFNHAGPDGCFGGKRYGNLGRRHLFHQF